MDIRAKVQQGRNELCSCGSGLKFKRCHGDPIKLQQCKAAAMEAARDKMTELIYEEVKKHATTADRSVPEDQSG